MLHMVSRIILYLSISVMVLAGDQSIDINLNLKFPGASQKMIGEKMVIDLGYLREGEKYNNIEIGSVEVKITQRKTSEDEDGCVLQNLEFDTVNTRDLEGFSERIDSKDKVYIGEIGNSIILTAKDIDIIDMTGDIDRSNEEFYFVAQECIGDEYFKGIALTSFSYKFKLYADIEGDIKKESIVGAFAQDSTGVEISIKRLIENQIKNGRLKIYKRRK